ncbi:3-deoxy-manno-octulosonate cytidylyltransferase [Candidatus Chlamydia corallus]|uniref:3-deoxy-manno-octulosonate cytidylyltransferase n=1 Tax=Candidatus Chlamydia corallus TaxID=2038470 RepID=UPI000C2FF0EE|nr:3-deoxy-manno-octulosonate cytidylyltransferase [Candidatus Chlamydia corallus]
MNKQESENLCIGVLPARWNSSRFPGKPLAKILGKSVIQRAYENASQSSLLDKVVVATDDQRIMDHVADFGGYAVMTSLTCLNGTERTGEVALNYFPNAQIIVNIQGDEPCLKAEVVDCLVQKLKDCPEAELATPIALTTDPEEILTEKKVKCVFDCKGQALYFSRSPIPYILKKATPIYLHIGVYAFKREALFRYLEYSSTPLSDAEDLEQLRFLEHGGKIHVCTVDAKSPSVDYPEDIDKVEKYITCLSNAYS